MRKCTFQNNRLDNEFISNYFSGIEADTNVDFNFTVLHSEKGRSDLIYGFTSVVWFHSWKNKRQYYLINPRVGGWQFEPIAQ
jgi:hypothetical protein